MSTPINLNAARKARARAAKRAQADANAVKFGRTKAQKASDAAQAKQRTTALDGHRIERDDDALPPGSKP